MELGEDGDEGEEEGGLKTEVVLLLACFVALFSFKNLCWFCFSRMLSFFQNG